MAKGDAPLILSLVLMVVSAGLFLAGFGSREWVVDTSPAITYSYSLWQKCVYSNGSATCDRIRPGTPKAYNEVTKVVECFALVSFGFALLSCFTAEDRPPSISPAHESYLPRPRVGQERDQRPYEQVVTPEEWRSASPVPPVVFPQNVTQGR